MTHFNIILPISTFISSIIHSLFCNCKAIHLDNHSIQCSRNTLKFFLLNDTFTNIILANI